MGGAQFVIGMVGELYSLFTICFAALADVTRGLNTVQTAKYLSIGEGAAWVGLLLGPLCQGMVAAKWGPQRAFFVPATASGILLLVATFFQETLEPDRRRKLTWHRATPLGSVMLIPETKTVTILSAAILLTILGSDAVGRIAPLFIQNRLDWNDFQLGIWTSAVYGSSAFGLLLIMPILLSKLRLKSILIVGIAGQVISLIFFSMVTNGWELYAVLVLKVFEAMMWPVYRASVSSIMGGRRYGESLALVAFLQCVGVFAGSLYPLLYKYTMDVAFGPFSCVAFLAGAFCSAVNLCVMIYVPELS